MARQWDDFEQVVSGLQIAADQAFDSAQKVWLGIPGIAGVYLRRLRFRRLYRSAVITALAEAIRQPRSREQYCRALERAAPILAPGIGLYLCAFGMSVTGVAIYFIQLAEARKDAARRLRELACC